MRREFRPIDRWPWPRTPDGQRQRSRFEATYSDTIQLLDRELERLDADVAYLCLDLAESQILKDRSGPYANARPDFPGVLLVIEGTDHGTLRYGTDQFHGAYTGQPSWHHNLRAIALGLEALRKVERYGITQGGQQYRGFAALPAPEGVSGSGSHMTYTEAVDLLGKYAGFPGAPGEVDPSVLIRRARAATHPDRHGGDATRWDRVEVAVGIVSRQRQLTGGVS